MLQSWLYFGYLEAVTKEVVPITALVATGAGWIGLALHEDAPRDTATVSGSVIWDWS